LMPQATSMFVAATMAQQEAPCSNSAGLFGTVVELREECAALAICLERNGLLSTEAFHAELHRRRFAAAWRAHPFDLPSHRSLGDLLQGCPVQSIVAQLAGLPAAQALCNASQGLRAGLASALGPLRKGFGKLYVCGGHDGTHVLSSAECFNPASSSWEPLPPLRQQRYAAAAAALHGQLYVCGGHDGMQHLGNAERFDPVVGSWEELPTLMLPRRAAAAAALGNCIYVCGGDVNQRAFGIVERWWPDTGSWEAVVPLMQQRYAAAAAAVGGKLYISGGIDNNDELRSVERFTPGGQFWELVTRCLGVEASLRQHRLVECSTCAVDIMARRS